MSQVKNIVIIAAGTAVVASAWYAYKNITKVSKAKTLKKAHKALKHIEARLASGAMVGDSRIALDVNKGILSSQIDLLKSEQQFSEVSLQNLNTLFDQMMTL